MVQCLATPLQSIQLVNKIATILKNVIASSLETIKLGAFLLQDTSGVTKACQKLLKKYLQFFSFRNEFIKNLTITDTIYMHYLSTNTQTFGPTHTDNKVSTGVPEIACSYHRFDCLVKWSYEGEENILIRLL